MTTGVNAPITFTENLFKSLIWDPLVKAAMTALDVEVPVLAVWPLSSIINGVVNLASNAIFTQVRLLVDVTAIKLLNAEHEAEYNSAAEKLAVIAHDQGVDSDAFIQQREIAKAALSKFVQFNQ